MNQPIKTVCPVYYQDSGHGWLAVKREWLQTLGLEHQITPYSYQRGQTVYLEEDFDMANFLDCAKGAWWQVNYSSRHTDGRSPIRSYDPYTYDPDSSI